VVQQQLEAVQLELADALAQLNAVQLRLGETVVQLDAMRLNLSETVAQHVGAVNALNNAHVEELEAAFVCAVKQTNRHRRGNRRFVP
jgi:hypothetical protein